MLRLRTAERDDCGRLFNWANEESVRAASFCSEPIAWDTHVRWFQEKLSDPDCTIYIVMDGAGEPVGQVRLEVSGSEATVSVGLDAGRRGQGYGAAAIRIACEAFLDASGIERIHAYIKPDNPASLAAFQKAGFVSDGDTTVHGQPALRFVLAKSVVTAEAQ